MNATHHKAFRAIVDAMMADAANPWIGKTVDVRGGHLTVRASYAMNGCRVDVELCHRGRKRVWCATAANVYAGLSAAAVLVGRVPNGYAA